MDSLSHSSYLLQQLQEQRIQGLLCDCMLVVKGVCFKAHKNVLAAFSSYFRSLFQNAPSQKSDVFNLVIQDVSGMGQVLDYMYTSHLDVNPDNVHALLDIAQCLQVPNVQNMCNSFLKPCPPAVDIPAFPLGGALSADHDCLLGNTGLPHDVDMQCPPEAHRPVSGDSDQTKRPSSSGNAPLEKQLVHGYKLRNFYSKQYFRQLSSANPGPCPASEEQPVVSNPTMSTATPQGSLTAADNLNSGDSMMNKPVRPKKAVYLKKYNYLRSQKALEEMCAESVSEPVPCPTPTLQERCAVQPVAPPAAVVEHEVAQDAVTEPQPPSPTPVEPEEPPLPAPVPPPTGHRQYCCPDCGKVFKHPSNLELHKRSHTGEKPFQCNVCGRHFSQAGNLQTHLRRHSGEKPYICELCGKGFTAAGDVQRHKVVHSGERPHLCDICGRGFNNLSNLKEHKRTHSTENSFTCDQCGKSFNTHRKLLKHRSRHSGEKPHSCATCGKSFVGSGDLQRHIRSHTGEKPYICDECGKSFSRSAMLRRHRTTHCRGPQSQSLPSNPQDAGNSPHSSLPKSHSKCPAASGGQTFSSTLPNSGPEKPLLPAHAETRPPRPASSAAPPHSALPELRSLVPPHLLSTASQDRTQLKVPKPQLLSGFEPCADSGAVKVGRTVVGRPYLPPADTPCTSAPLHGPSISHSPSAPPHGPSAPPHGPSVRSSEGQFMSSVTLWGLAMKTLQNDTD